MIAFAAKKLSTDANGQREDAASPFLSAQFDRQVMVGQWLLTGANEKKLDAASPSCLRSFNRAVIPSVSSM